MGRRVNRAGDAWTPSLEVTACLVLDGAGEEPVAEPLGSQVPPS